LIAQYGYQDGEGTFFVTVDQTRCAACEEKPCIPSCPRGVFVQEEDPYGETVVAVEDRKRKKLKYECMGCKPGRPGVLLPCVAACPSGVLVHSW
jgi:Fe-S-cluster-containing hydrogenase component 2